eukprot:CAMPEP_0114980036 /NCGR_PEP_ID=MMETSP0216-20121206/4728_1 /TAXON_ID=223996 /ORGANISM="Protocruzia adherens, Strain Boccale" /LENGTH=326 /DNA_ID=CAMNT_0002341477 /DNA_START=138 /DNA_END=1115 /DNA_ORIENTATION=-
MSRVRITTADSRRGLASNPSLIDDPQRRRRLRQQETLKNFREKLPSLMKDMSRKRYSSLYASSQSLPVDEHSFTNFLAFFGAVVVGSLAPYIILRYALSLELACVEDQSSAEGDIDCSEHNPIGGIVLSVTRTVCLIGISIMAGQLTLSENSKRLVIYQSTVFVITNVAITFVMLGDLELYEFTLLALLLVSVFSGIIFDCKTFNRGGFHLLAAFLAQDLLMFYSLIYVGPYLSKEIWLGVTWAFFTPIFIQLNQGLVGFVTTYISKRTKFTYWNTNEYVLMTKFQIGTINCIKFVVLLSQVKAKNPYPLFIFSLLTDALGRVQLW